LSLLLRGCDARGALRASLQGARQMVPAMVILWFAWALSSMTDPEHLDTGGYLSRILSDRLDVRLLPTVVFVLAGALAFSTGTSWGTMGILTPLSISLVLRMDPSGQPDSSLVLATCGSVLAGAIFGDHCSPISDTTVLSSQSSGCNHLAHVRTQMPYALTVAAVCITTGTIPAALDVSPWISLLTGSLLLFALVRWLGKPPDETIA
jgi:Na+/H+ antiporter NhaC